MENFQWKNIVHFDLKGDDLLVNLRDLSHPICKVSGIKIGVMGSSWLLLCNGHRGRWPPSHPPYPGVLAKPMIYVYDFALPKF
jgi:hypothetical protein